MPESGHIWISVMQDPESLERIAIKKNKLLKGGKPDVLLAARMMIQDWQKGKIMIMQDSCTDTD